MCTKLCPGSWHRLSVLHSWPGPACDYLINGFWSRCTIGWIIRPGTGQQNRYLLEIGSLSCSFKQCLGCFCHSILQHIIISNYSIAVYCKSFSDESYFKQYFSYGQQDNQSKCWKHWCGICQGSQCKELFIYFNRVYFLCFCTKYETWFLQYLIKLIVTLCSTNATKVLSYKPEQDHINQLLLGPFLVSRIFIIWK